MKVTYHQVTCTCLPRGPDQPSAATDRQTHNPWKCNTSHVLFTTLYYMYIKKINNASNKSSNHPRQISPISIFSYSCEFLGHSLPLTTITAFRRLDKNKRTDGLTDWQTELTMWLNETPGDSCGSRPNQQKHDGDISKGKQAVRPRVNAMVKKLLQKKNVIWAILRTLLSLTMSLGYILSKTHQTVIKGTHNGIQFYFSLDDALPPYTHCLACWTHDSHCLACWTHYC